MTKGINEKQADKTARVKRADLTAMQERFDAIVTVANTPVFADMPSEAAHILQLIIRIAKGDSLDNLITEAGRAALGLE